MQKLIAAAGVASRRGAEDLLRSGRVSVNDRPAQLGESADPERDVIAVDGVPLRAPTHIYWLLNKPRGVLSTVRDTHGRATVVDLLPDDLPRLFPVGRPDRDTEGLLLLTNDGELTHSLLHPSFEIEREYRVTVKGRIVPRTLRQLASGVALDDGITAPARVGRAEYDASSDTSRFTLTLIEGKKRQVRRSLATLRHPVESLLRVRMGPLRLGDLASGSARALERGEVDALARLMAKARRQGNRPPGQRGKQP